MSDFQKLMLVMPSDEEGRREARAAALLEGMIEGGKQAPVDPSSVQATNVVVELTSPSAVSEAHQSQPGAEQSLASGRIIALPHLQYIS